MFYYFRRLLRLYNNVAILTTNQYIIWVQIVILNGPCISIFHLTAYCHFNLVTYYRLSLSCRLSFRSGHSSLFLIWLLNVTPIWLLVTNFHWTADCCSDLANYHCLSFDCRLSFPSGHASLSFYAATFTVVSTDLLCISEYITLCVCPAVSLCFKNR